MLQATAGYDRLDPTSVNCPIDSYANALSVKTKPRIGVVRRPFFDDLDPEIEKAADEALKQLGELSSDVLEINLPSTPTGVQAPEVYAVHSKYFLESPDLYLPWMRERLRQAANVDTSAYVAARQELDRLRDSVGEVFSEVDFLVTPTTPVPPITIKEAMNMSPKGLPLPADMAPKHRLNACISWIFRKLTILQRQEPQWAENATLLGLVHTYGLRRFVSVPLEIIQIRFWSQPRCGGGHEITGSLHNEILTLGYFQTTGSSSN
jgi:hypothetical protein